jgi:hypothetical protein
MIGMNLNQSLDVSQSPPTAGSPLAFDASALKGFSFEISGAIMPPPNALRFEVESASGVFCNVPSTKIRRGVNTVLFSELVSQCFRIVGSNPTAETAQSALLKIAWHVVPNTSGQLAYDFCVSNVRALPE